MNASMHKENYPGGMFNLALLCSAKWFYSIIKHKIDLVNLDQADLLWALSP